MDSVGNLQRRFQLLFTLPSTINAFFLATTTSIAILLAQFFVRGEVILLLIPLFLGVFFVSVGIDKVILRGSPFTTTRRLLTMSVIPNLAWFVLSLLGLLLLSYTGSVEQFYLMVLMGLFSAIGLRTLILGSVFFDNMIIGFLVSTIQPLLLLPMVIPVSQLQIIAQREMVSIALGFAIPSSIVVYLTMLNRSAKGIISASPLKFLRAFLLAWATDNPELFEEIVERDGSSRSVQTHVIEFSGVDQHQVLVIPEIHPGPFYPVGSSNLPYQLYQRFSEMGYLPLVFHGISGHDRNLPSKVAVNDFLRSLSDSEVVSQGDECTVPFTVSKNKGTVTGMVFNDYAVLIVTLAPYGMEDFPNTVRDAIGVAAQKSGYRGSIIIDAHNSRGESPSDDDCNDVVLAAEDLLNKMRLFKQEKFKVGQAHSSEFPVSFKSDMGPGAVGVILFKIGQSEYVIVSVDSNNMIMGFREKVMEALGPKSNLVEICTTDTHYNASKIMNPIGYLPLGQMTGVNEFADVISKLINIARQRINNTKFEIKVSNTNVRVIGNLVLNTFSIAVDKVIGFAKMGGLFTGIIVLMIYFVVVFR